MPVSGSHTELAQLESEATPQFTSVATPESSLPLLLHLTPNLNPNLTGFNSFAMFAGFSSPYSRCCSNSCGVDGQGYTVCADPSNHVIFDSIHPTEAAWKAVTGLYTVSAGYTKGPTLAAWIQDNGL